MSEETPPHSKAQVQSLLDKLLPPNEEMDPSSALLIIERSGADSVYSSEQLKLRLERKVDEMRSQGLDVPADLLRVRKGLSLYRGNLGPLTTAWANSLILR